MQRAMPNEARARTWLGWSSIARRQAASIAAHRLSIQATKPSTWSPSADSPCSRAAVASAFLAVSQASRAGIRPKTDASTVASARPVHEGAYVGSRRIASSKARRAPSRCSFAPEVTPLQIAAVGLEVRGLRPRRNRVVSRSEIAP